VDAGGKFTPLTAAVRRATREQVGIPADALVVGFVGRLVRVKGFAELMEAWRNLARRDRRLHLLVVGWLDDLEPELAPLGAASGNYLLRPHVQRRAIDRPRPNFCRRMALHLRGRRQGGPTGRRLGIALLGQRRGR
jgi:glycosyltransferase involved in cell wall biosynthesis